MKYQGRTKKQKPVLSQWRFATVGAGIALLFIVLVARTAYIQVVEPDQLRYQGDLRSLRITTTEAQRGMIEDRNGEVLAVSVPVETVWADPKLVHDKGSLQHKAAWQALADVLDDSYDSLYDKVKNPKKRFVYLKRQVSSAVADYIRKLKLPGIYLRPESRRFYPTGEINAQLVGLTNIDDKGIAGIELSYNQWLAGSATERRVRKDRLGHVIENMGVVREGKKPHQLTLSIDQRIQSMAYKALKRATAYNQATSASLVMIKVNTGEILAMANTPSYNPNNRSDYRSFRARDRAITDAYEPGSTLKPLIMVSALEHKVVEPDSIIDTSPGWLYLGAQRVSDEGHNYGKITLGQILEHSSNMGMTKIALRETPQQMLSTLYNLGIGNTTGVGLTGEAAGFMPQRRRWSKFEQATLSFGYGVTVTPLQLAYAYSILGNGGIRYPLSILKLNKAPRGSGWCPSAMPMKWSRCWRK
nr:penicillin-binding transpeptidase domain-containing protein [Dongshaea marina]